MNEVVSTVLLTLFVMSPAIILELICDYVMWKERRCRN